MEKGRQDPYCFINQDPQRLGKRQSRLALMAAVMMVTEAAATPASPFNSTPDRYVSMRDPDAECAAYEDRDYMTVEKQQRNNVQTKQHKKHKFHVPTKTKPTGKLAGFLERVTDPNKKEREAEFMKNPFRGFPR